MTLGLLTFVAISALSAGIVAGLTLLIVAAAIAAAFLAATNAVRTASQLGTVLAVRHPRASAGASGPVASVR